MSGKHRSAQADQTYLIVEDDLNELLMRLNQGMRLNGRIVDELGEHLFILRVWGYNMVMESAYDFNRFDEVQLLVKQVSPDFQLELMPQQKSAALAANKLVIFDYKKKDMVIY